MYLRGYGAARDYAQAIEWLQKAAEQGYQAAAYELGNLYRDGLGVERDIEQALAWYEPASAYLDNAKSALYDLLWMDLKY